MFEHVVRKGGLKESETRYAQVQVDGCLLYTTSVSLHEPPPRAPLVSISCCRWFFQQLIVGVDYLHRMVRLGDTKSSMMMAATPHQSKESGNASKETRNVSKANGNASSPIVAGSGQ